MSSSAQDGVNTTELSVIDYSTAEAILRAHINYLRDRIAHEGCVPEKRVWQATVDELTVAFPWASSLTQSDLSSCVLGMRCVVPVLVVLMTLAACYYLTVRCTTQTPLQYVTSCLTHTLMGSFRQRAALDKWRTRVRESVPWIDAQARAQEKAHRLIAQLRQQQLRTSLTMIGMAEVLLLVMNMLPDVAHWGLRWILGPVAPFCARVFTPLMGQAQSAKGTTYSVVRATETLYLLYFFGPILLSVFFGLLQWATDSAHMVLDVRAAHPLVPALREEFARRRNDTLRQDVHSVRQDLQMIQEALASQREAQQLLVQGTTMVSDSGQALLAPVASQDTGAAYPIPPSEREANQDAEAASPCTEPTACKAMEAARLSTIDQEGEEHKSGSARDLGGTQATEELYE